MYLGNTPDSPIKYSAPGVCTRPLNQARERQGYFGRNWVNRPCCFQKHLEYEVGLGRPISVHAQDLHRRLLTNRAHIILVCFLVWKGTKWDHAEQPLCSPYRVCSTDLDLMGSSSIAMWCLNRCPGIMSRIWGHPRLVGRAPSMSSEQPLLPYSLSIRLSMCFVC